MKTTIVWFRNDLRLHDLPSLHAAADGSDHVVPLFILNSELLRGERSSSNRNRFLLESLEDLKQSLKKRGADLVIRDGKAEDVLPELAKEVSADAVHYTIDYSPFARERDKVVTEALEGAGVDVQAFPGRLAVDSFKGVYAGNGNVYKVFTPFWKNWGTLDRRPVHGAPAKLSLPSGVSVGRLPNIASLTKKEQLSPDVLPGGESAGRKRMHDFLRNKIDEYGDRHDSLTPDGTSRLSPYLHFGCISVRELEQLVQDHTSTTNGAARFHRQLAWREFYNYVLLHFPDNTTQEFQERYRDMEWIDADDKEGARQLKAWEDGQTGYPIIDAGMRQLLQEGWMHNRARLIVGSFLTKDLNMDWRLGESHFLRWLQDGDMANNNGNWQWIASVGVDPAPVFRRLYNPMTQQKRYDEDGDYVRKYVPELSKVPQKYLAEPWNMPAEEQEKAGCIIGKDYPKPVVDHAEARKIALDRYRR